MVKHSDLVLNRVYGALADATRRLILEQLAAQEMSVSEVAGPFRISLPAISRHLRVLESANLLAREKQGRSITCRLAAPALLSAGEWLTGYRGFWEQRFEALDKYLREERAGGELAATRTRRNKSSSRLRSGTPARMRTQARHPSLDATFAALADATRRRILHRLRSGAVTVTELAEPFAISLPAISKHLRVLESSGLLGREKSGRKHSCHLLASPLQLAAAWIGRYARMDGAECHAKMVRTLG